MKGIHDMHRERLRERFLTEGIDGFSPHNALELLLFFAISRKDVNNLAHTLINRFGSFSGVFDASYDELLKVKGVGNITATLIKLIPDIARLYVHDKRVSGNVLDTPDKQGDFVVSRFIGRTREAVFVLLLDRKYRLINCKLLCEGSLNRVEIYLRELIELVVGTGASYVVMAHNHLNGLMLPSKSDLEVTIQVRTALEYINTNLLDHLIICNDEFVSLADSGYLSEEDL